VSAATSRYVRLMLTRSGRANWTAPTLSRTARHLLEVIAHYADLEGHAFPAVDTLAERMGITPANVRRARAELVAAGIIAVDLGGGQGNSNTYRLPVMSPIRGEDLSTSRAPARGFDDPQPARQRASNPRASARGRSIEDPRVTSTDAVPRAALNRFGGWSSGQRRYEPRGPNRRGAQ